MSFRKSILTEMNLNDIVASIYIILDIEIIATGDSFSWIIIANPTVVTDYPKRSLLLLIKMKWFSYVSKPGMPKQDLFLPETFHCVKFHTKLLLYKNGITIICLLNLVHPSNMSSFLVVIVFFTNFYVWNNL